MKYYLDKHEVTEDEFYLAKRNRFKGYTSWDMELDEDTKHLDAALMRMKIGLIVAVVAGICSAIMLGVSGYIQLSP